MRELQTIEVPGNAAHGKRKRKALASCLAVSWCLGFLVLLIVVAIAEWGLGRAIGGRSPREGFVILEEGELVLVSASHPDAFSCVGSLWFVMEEDIGLTFVFPIQRVHRRQLLVRAVPNYQSAIETRKDSWRPVMRDILVDYYEWPADKAAAVLLPDEVHSSPHWMGICLLLLVPLAIGVPLRVVIVRSVRSHRMNRWSDALAANRCPSCGYDTRNLTERRCPECGQSLTWNPYL